MDKTQYDVLLGEVRSVKDHVTDIDFSLEKDRQSLQDFNVRLSAVEAQLEELRKTSNKSAERIRTKIEAVVEPVIESTDRLTTQIKNKKMVVLKAETRRWWKRLFNWR